MVFSQKKYHNTGLDPSVHTHFCSFLTLSGPAFSVVRLARGGGGLSGPDAENQGEHQLIEMKLCMSHYYSHKSIPDAKFESSIFSFSSFGDITSQNFPLKRGTSHRIR